MEGTPIRLRLSRTISSATEQVGNEVNFEVLEEVKVNEIVVIPKGSLAIGTVIDAEHKKTMGRAGRLQVNIDSVRLADGEKAALKATEGGKAGGHVGAMTGAMVATSIVLLPAAPLFLFIHGKDMTIPEGTEVTAYVNGDFQIDPAKFVATAHPTGVSAAKPSVTVVSTPSGADIEINGSFMGNTPSTVEVEPGDQNVVISKKGYQPWSRKLKVTGGNVNINAELDASGAKPN